MINLNKIQEGKFICLPQQTKIDIAVISRLQCLLEGGAGANNCSPLSSKITIKRIRPNYSYGYNFSNINFIKHRNNEKKPNDKRTNAKI